MTHPTDRTVTSAPRSNRHLLRRLDGEWIQLCHRHARVGAVASWGVPGEPLRLSDALILAGYRPNDEQRNLYADAPSAEIDDEAVDVAMIALLRAAKTDQLAARTVLQRILPGLAAIARRKGYNVMHQAELLDDLVANAWTVILRYPVERRPARVIANLLLDSSFETFVRPVRLKRSSEVPRSHDMFADAACAPAVDPLEEFVELMHEVQACGVSPADVSFLCRLISDGGVSEMARQQQVTERTIRNHRTAVVYRVRQAVVDAA